MLAQRVACQTPWGEVHDLVVVEGRVVVPGQLADMRSLEWLGAEHHPRLAVTALSVLERATGAALGLSPYCVAAERWNQAAEDDPWLPVVSRASDRSGTASGAPALAVGAAAVLLPAPAPRSMDRERSTALDRLRSGGLAVGSLFDVVRVPLRAALQLVGVAACTYYVLTAASWLWGLRDGMDAAELQAGVLVLLVGVLLSGITGALWDRSPRTGCDGLGSDAVRRFQPIVDTTLGAYRLAIALQLVAFAGFAMS